MAFDLNSFAKELGWSSAGVCTPNVDSETKEKFEEWLQNYKGDQMNYLVRQKEKRLSPELYFKDVKSVLVFSSYYFPGWAQGEVKVSNYSWGSDYHHSLKSKLENTAAKLRAELGEFQFIPTVDTSPILEKYFAVKSGIGWQAKNSLIISRDQGSLFFLAEILTDLPPSTFSSSKIQADYCGNCTRCIDACPTQALEPYVLIADRCISYLTLEHKGEFAEETPAYSEWVAGCDICQEVCPWNQKLIPLDQTDKSLANLNFSDVADTESWLEKISSKAVSYVKPKNWKRNLDHISPSKK